MSRYIDADKFIKRLKASPAFPNMGTDGYFLLGVVEDLLKSFPTADVVEVVRCKDCKHKITANFNGEILIGCDNKSALMDVYSNDSFCSYGKRREG